MARTVEPGHADHEAVRIEPVSVRIREACRLTGIGRSKFYELIASGEVEVVKIGAMTLVPYRSLQALISRRTRHRAHEGGGGGQSNRRHRSSCRGRELPAAALRPRQD